MAEAQGEKSTPEANGHVDATQGASTSDRDSRNSDGSSRALRELSGERQQRRGLFGCCQRRRKEVQFQQTFVVLRHSERVDHVNPAWKETPEGLKWTFDTPITERGHELAKEVAVEMESLQTEACFGAVVSSPYRRCLETAAKVATLLDLPIVIDREIGEVMEKEHMPKEGQTHRSPVELMEFCEELGVKVKNPIENGGVKMFGVAPVWPETLEQGYKRYMVRFEMYIKLSVQNRCNYIIVTHAAAVSASMMMFGRGNADVKKMDYCGRVIARRTVPSKTVEEEQLHGVYAAQWTMEVKAVEHEVNLPDERVKKLYENQHFEFCDEVEGQSAQRRERRTRTDQLCEDQMAVIALDSMTRNSFSSQSSVKSRTSESPDTDRV